MADLYTQKLTPSELEYCAENELIYICPSTSTPEPFRFLCGNFGPLVAGVNVQVPLWLALTLKESNKARLILPDWMRLARLQAAAAEEEDVDGLFAALPFHFVEVAEVILRAAEDDCAADGESAEALSDQLQHIITLRERKLQKGMAQALASTKDPNIMDDLLIPISNVGAMEVAGLREGFMRVRGGAP